jgi:hypothetical protein
MNANSRPRRSAALLWLSVAAVTPAHAGIPLDRYEDQLAILEHQVSLACASERPGEARAFMAYRALERGNELVNDVNHWVAAIDRFLKNPEATAVQEFQQELTLARIAFKDEMNEYDLARLGRAPASEMSERRLRVRALRVNLRSLERTDPLQLPEVRLRSREQLAQAMTDLTLLARVGDRLDVAVRKAEGCWATATNNTKRAHPGIELELSGGSGPPPAASAK